MEADRFEQIVGTDRVWLPPDEQIDGVPVALVVRPGSPEQVAACLHEATERGAALVTSAGGSKLGWGNPPAVPSLLRLDLSALDARIDVDADEGIATTQAAVPLAELEGELAALGKRTWLSGGGYAGATVGGTVAVDPLSAGSGPERRTRNELLGLEVALSDGRLVKAGGRVVKNVTGFDLVRLHCGALGTLGVITEVTFRLRPCPAGVRVLTRPAAAWPAAVALAAELLASGAGPVGVAVVGEATGRLLWRLEGGDREIEGRARRFEGERVDETAWGSVDTALAGAPSGGRARLRLMARPSDTGSLVQVLLELAGEACVRVALPALGAVAADVPESAVGRLFETCEERGWAVIVEAASAELKQRVDVFGPPLDTLPLMRAMKQRFDPRGVLSPGRYAGRI